jgi:hypothetical protein
VLFIMEVGVHQVGRECVNNVVNVFRGDDSHVAVM